MYFQDATTIFNFQKSYLMSKDAYLISWGNTELLLDETSDLALWKSTSKFLCCGLVAHFKRHICNFYMKRTYGFYPKFKMSYIFAFLWQVIAFHCLGAVCGRIFNFCCYVHCTEPFNNILMLILWRSRSYSPSDV